MDMTFKNVFTLCILCKENIPYTSNTQILNFSKYGFYENLVFIQDRIRSDQKVQKLNSYLR
jgi:hypothetical protein